MNSIIQFRSNVKKSKNLYWKLDLKIQFLNDF